jgi:hypothetical protein
MYNIGYQSINQGDFNGIIKVNDNYYLTSHRIIGGLNNYTVIEKESHHNNIKYDETILNKNITFDMFLSIETYLYGIIKYGMPELPIFIFDMYINNDSLKDISIKRCLSRVISTLHDFQCSYITNPRYKIRPNIKTYKYTYNEFNTEYLNVIKFILMHKLVYDKSNLLDGIENNYHDEVKDLPDVILNKLPKTISNKFIARKRLRKINLILK